jgi:phosphoserine phosphatase
MGGIYGWALICESMKKLILVDFDETLYHKNSMLVFTRWYFGFWRYYFGLLCLSPILIAYLLRFSSATFTKTKWLSFFFGGMDASKFKQIGRTFSKKRIPLDLNEELYNYLKKEQDSATICIVTASANEWLDNWVDHEKFMLIATALSYSKDRFTGQLSGKNCNGKEKVHRILQQFDLTSFDRIEVIGYGRGDLPMHGLSK